MLTTAVLCLISACLANETSDANESTKYLDAVRTFADNVLKYGRDTYGPKHTPLFVDGLNIHTHEPVKWMDPDGTKWILYCGALGDSTHLRFDWGTTATSPGKHTLRATIAPVVGEEHVADNSMTVEVEVNERRESMNKE
jgi:hypothetical protein